MKIVLITDTHCGCRNSSEIIQDYQNRFYKEVFFPYLIKENIKHIIHLGDFFDNRKFLSIKTLHSNRKAFLEPLRDNGIHMDIILGNHDVHYKTTNDVNSLKEVLGFFVNSVDIISSPVELRYGSMIIGALPWIAPDNYDETMRFIQTTDSKVIVSHLELSGFEMAKGQPPSSSGMDHKLFSRFGAVYSGHFHTKSSRDNIHYLGTPFELTWADCHDPKFFHVLDTETGKIEAIRNPLVLHRKIYYDDSAALPNIDDIQKMCLAGCFVRLYIVKKKDYVHCEKFIQAVQDTLPAELKIAETYTDSVGETQESLEMSENTEALLHAYIDELTTDLSKDRLKSMLSELYVEAESQETI